MSWNINGLRRKITDNDFLTFLSDYDLIFLSETWLSGNDTTNYDIDGYMCEHIYGNKRRNTSRGRYGGGIAVYYKKELKQYIKIVQKEQCGIIWVKISAELFPFDQDVFLCHVYVPPTFSKSLNSSNMDFYDILESHITKYNDLGKIYITGDINARTSDCLDYFVFDKYLDQNLTFMNSSDIPIRVNQDRIIDYNGRYLLDLCQSTGLLIANGRFT